VEMLVTSLILMAIVGPIAAIMLASGSSSARTRLATAADQLAASKIELIRGMDYDSIGVAQGNPSGSLPSTAQSVTVANTAATISYKVSYVDDHGAKTQTYADYKLVTVTVTRVSDSKILSQKTTYVASAEGAPNGGQDYVVIKRQFVDMDAATTSLGGVAVALTNGPSAPRNDVTDSNGNVIFPELKVNTSSNYYDTKGTLANYTTYPQDLPPWAVAHGQYLYGTTDGFRPIRMYKTGISVPVTLSGFSSGGTWTVYMGGPVCGNTLTPSGSGSTGSGTFSSCNLNNTYLPLTNIAIPPISFTFSATRNVGGSGMTYSAPVVTSVRPAAYPNAPLTSPTVRLSMYPNPVPSSSTISLPTKVTKGGSVVNGAIVEVTDTSTGNSNAPSIYLYAPSNSSGLATFTVPKPTSGSTSYTVTATDYIGATKTINVTVSSTTSSLSTQTLAIS